MTRLFPVKQVMKGLVRRSHWLDSLTFTRIFFLWIIVVVIFGIFYLFLSSPDSSLIYARDGTVVSNLADTVYFSFITATTTGFGDIAPMGYFKIISIFEVILGLMLLAFVTSRLVSIKQDMMLSEIYEISYNERINRLRSSLVLFRQNLTRFIGKVESGTATKRELGQPHNNVISLHEILREIFVILPVKKRTTFSKESDTTYVEVLYNSILVSFERVYDLIRSLEEKKVDWKKEQFINLIKMNLETCDKIFQTIEANKEIPEKIKLEILSNKETVIKEIKQKIK